ncbi:hypothetical protein DL764_001485 [Monosporascus ibericus]|uniref:Peptidase S8/S53 domain-containing protein n=1 Tax=Monosporascus ibericus TaxID=155417 RepID=A0A4Q4TR06_9PEZI|nr:hypothetical protein DL764_001485 [Monosporascus ibericus]
MKLQYALLALFGGALAQDAPHLSHGLDAVADVEPSMVPGAYIVEFEDNEDAGSFYGDLRSQNMEAEPRLDLTYSLFKGCSFQLKNTSDVDVAAQRISEMPKIRKMWPVRIHEIPKDELIWAGNAEAARSSLRKRQEPGNDTFSPHVMTQVDKLRAEGFTGAGIRIGVVDSGVDYNHPALGGCFGEGCLISYGTDLVGDEYNGGNTPVPDPDPLESCGSHGTHVAGIIAAQENELGFTGAAPGVTLGMYRVFGCNGGASDDVLIAAFNRAFEDGSDIITASIGSASGWSESPWAVLAQRIVEAGVPVTIAAGNGGSAGLFYSSTAADGKEVTAVASVDNTETPIILSGATFRAGNGSAESFGWQDGFPSYGNVSLPLWAVSNNTEVEDDACNALPDDTPDLANYMVLIRETWTSCSLFEQAQNLAAKGARYIMVYSSVPDVPIPLNVQSVPEIISIGMVTSEQGAEWVNLLNEGKRVTVDMTEYFRAPAFLDFIPSTARGGLLSEFTSWGPTWEVDLKPQVAAPGGNILSTYPLNLGGYAVESGTSMSCPLTAAAYALVAEARGTLDPSTLERLFSSTASPKVWAEGSRDRLAPVAQQGAGLIQAYDAAYATTILSVASISFNDTDNFVPSANFTIENLGSEEVTYELDHRQAVTMYTFKEGELYPASYPNPIADAYAALEFSESKVTVPAGGSKEITVIPTPPSGLDEKLLPVYSGYITVNGTSGELLSIPYLGVVGSMYAAPSVLDPDWVFVSNWSDFMLPKLVENTVFTIPYPTDPTGEPQINATYPASVIQLNVGTALLRCDLVPHNDSANATAGDVSKVPPIGSIARFPVEFTSRRYFITAFTGMLADGSVAPEGRYSFRVRALKIFGDAAKEEDYEAVETVPFEIVYT